MIDEILGFVKKVAILLVLLVGIIGILTYTYFYFDVKRPAPSEWLHNSPKIEFREDNLEENCFKLAGVKKTGSMKPAISDTSHIILLECFDSVKEGDIVAYGYNGNDYLLHRIRYIFNFLGEEYIIVRGDNNLMPEFIDYEDISYVVVGVIY